MRDRKAHGKMHTALAGRRRRKGETYVYDSKLKWFPK